MTSTFVLDLSAARYFVKQYLNRGYTMDAACKALKPLGLTDEMVTSLYHDYQLMAEVAKPKSLGDKIKDLLNTVAATGLDLERAARIEGLTDEELDFLANNELFMADYSTTLARYEQNLLRDVKTCKEMNVERGVSTEARWLLEKQFGGRYGSKSSVEVTNMAIPEPIAIPRDE